ncbi:sulfurtransferase-like selenium metabolism protein YedF [Lactonifactor longoviformis]|uniref:Selenium metabolism protein YedF n=1 Tax=Lactonifactor longoviformis DSM 17459 TaxID=1122155 RepID=A0A1M4T534_9CLOT|nr:sulfurtransferase-like selenium metabolism protein YedF [Lactonifactor longoviformis]POP34590.1 sulfurtransferase-like selenium metabolism protein YedF [Lactonifactor longoviformis]SHE39616.1 selenium metabolism protein YedF [Lactonifactor longoviformis DSM 17459]
MEKTIDARGQQCPKPVIMTKKAMDEAAPGTVLLVQVDNEIAVSNLQKLAVSQNAEYASVQKGEKLYEVRITVTGEGREHPASQPAYENCCRPEENTVVVISSDKMGEGDEALGRTLMKGFIYALTQLPVPPKTVLLYNGGAKLSCEGSDSAEDLRALEQAGTAVLTCGTCLNHYGLGEKLAAGTVTNMYVIAETQAEAAKIIRP